MLFGEESMTHERNKYALNNLFDAKGTLQEDDDLNDRHLNTQGFKKIKPSQIKDKKVMPKEPP